MNIIVTCGPSIEPIDEVRRITNFSTGELGVILCEKMAAAGHKVFCLKGRGATHPGPGEACATMRFDTNLDLLGQFCNLAKREKIDAVFHAAALCDYKVKRVQNATGETLSSAKIESRAGALTIELEPATKVISELRPLFPHSLLIGWKYELTGTREEAIAKAMRQLTQCKTDACVLNGQAWGPGFGFIRTKEKAYEVPTKAAVAEFLVSWLDWMSH